MQSTKSTESPETQRDRRLVAWVVGTVVILLLVVAMIAAALGGAPSGSAPGPSPSPSAASIPTTSPSASPGSAPTPTIDPDFGQPVAQTVPKDQPADFGDLVTARISAITSVTATGTQPGEVSGPAVQVDLEITNGTSAEISLATVTVNAYYGADSTPASPYSQPPAEAFPDTLAAGASAKARYLFSVPADARDSVIITVGKSAGEPIVVFQ